MTAPDERLAALIEAMAPRERLAWGRIAAVDWFDLSLLHEILDEEEVPALPSPLLERLYDNGDSADPAANAVGGTAHRFRLRAGLRAPILAAQEIDVAWLVAHTADLAASFFAGRGRERRGGETLVEEIGYLALATPDEARERLAEVTFAGLRSGQLGDASAAAAVVARRLGAGLPFEARWGRARESLAAIADVVVLTAHLHAARTGGQAALGFARLLTVALARCGPAATAAEARFLRAARAMSDTQLATVEAPGAVDGIDDWRLALALVGSRRAVAKQSHEITFVSDTLVRYRQTSTVHTGGEREQHAVLPVPIGVVPRPLEALIDGVAPRDRAGRMLATLTAARSHRLLAASAVITSAFPPPGSFARGSGGVAAAYGRLIRLEGEVLHWLDDRDAPADPASMGALPPEHREALAAVLTGLRAARPVIALLEPRDPATQVVHYEIDMPSAPPQTSRLSGRVITQALVSGFAQADQYVTVTVPKGLIPLGAGPDVMEPQTVSPGRGTVVQHFRLGPRPHGTVLTGLHFSYGIGPVERLKTVTAGGLALLAALLLLFLTPFAAEEMSYSLLSFSLAAAGLGGLVDAALRLRWRGPEPQTGQQVLRRPWRGTVIGVLVAGTFTVAGLVLTAFTGESGIATVDLFRVAVGMAGFAVAVEFLQLLRDALASRSWVTVGRLGQNVSAGGPSRAVAAAAPLLERLAPRRNQPEPLAALAAQMRDHWYRRAAEVLLPVPVPLTMSVRRAGDIAVDAFADAFLAGGRPRWVVIGPPGSGKTGAVIRVASALLSDRSDKSERRTVPVEIEAAGWRPGRRPFEEWAAAQLRRPDLLPLIRDGRITLVLDGLDELPSAARSAVLRAVDTIGPDARVIMTCRSAEFRGDTSPAALIHSSATVAELTPLPPADSAAVLAAVAPAEHDAIAALVRNDEQRVRPLFGSPEMLRLAGVALAHPGTPIGPGNVEEALTRAALRSAYEQVDRPLRWLSFLGALAGATHSAQIEWFHLFHALGRPVRRLIAALVAALVVAGATAAGAALLGAVPARSRLLPVAALLLILAGVLALLRATPPSAPGRRFVRLAARDFNAYRMITTAGVALLCVGSATSLAGLPGDAIAKAIMAVTIGYSVCVPLVAVFLRLEFNGRPPVSGRRALLRLQGESLLAIGLPVLLSATLTLLFVDEWEIATATVAVVTIVGVALPGLLGVVGWYRLSGFAVAARGLLPWRMMAFLEGAADRGVLRRSGAAYGFRQQVFEEALIPNTGPARDRVRMTLAASIVGKFFKANEGTDFDDYAVCRQTGLLPSKTFPALEDFVAAGWLETRWKPAERRGDPPVLLYRYSDSRNNGLPGALAEFSLLHPEATATATRRLVLRVSR
ncbi:hypothetical protein [Verrucosispora sp. WMMD573]|uniref:hypothetical protein n=1 Tax=Verrucosispora sp. WMMD573 TaxID=3015149 RepID=UPI00248BFC6E|nr:hypothetical protein [Verrucosispora sp. WMMD573]WBB52400.1 hypothetical protein O7601_17580 [Verrucosispora sp. WMMD573]